MKIIITKEDIEIHKFCLIFKTNNALEDMQLLQRCFTKISINFNFEYTLIRNNDTYIQVLTPFRMVQSINNDLLETFCSKSRNNWYLLDLKQMAKFLGVK